MKLAGTKIVLVTALAVGGLAVLPAAPAQAAVAATLVKHTATGAGSTWDAKGHPSPDPSGITYNSRTRQLIISDGEVEETGSKYPNNVWRGTNLFVASLAGELVTTGLDTMAYTPEPTGVGFRPRFTASSGYTFPERLFVSDDDKHRVFEVNAGTDGVYGNTGDSWTSFDVAFLSHGPEADAEDVAVDLEMTRNGQLLIVDGLNTRAFVYNPGPDHVFNGQKSAGGDDFIERVVDVGSFGAGDPEGIAYNAYRNTVFVLDDTSNKIYEIALTGALLNEVTLPFTMKSGAGIALAPASDGSGGQNAYIVDRGVDNDSNQSTFNDGRLSEITIPGLTAPNSAPTVSAGPDRSTTVGTAATLSGSVTDDGTAGTTAAWSRVGGTGTGAVSFANASAPSTTATFSAAGTYVLRLTGSDGRLSATDDMTVTVTSSGSTTTNGPPTVSAGPDRAVTLPSSASLDGTVGDATPTGTLTSAWSETSGPGEVTFGSASAVDTTASFSAAGTYVLRLTATDGSAAPASDETTVVVSPAATGAGGITEVEVPVRAGSDDAEQVPGKSADLTSSDLELAVDGTKVQTVGLRFTGVNVPKGSSITGAYVQFQTDEAKTAAATLTVAGQAADNPGTFTTAVGSVTGRQATAAKVPWSPAGWSTVGARTETQRTPDLSGVVQEIVDRPGWGSGNAMVVLVTGSGTRTAEAFEGGAARAAVLHIEYSSGPVTNTPPTVSAGPDRAVTLPSSASLDGTVGDATPTGTLTSSWSETSGPGEVTFGSASAVDTTASFSVAGTYVLRLTATDGSAAPASDEMTVTVAAEPSGSTTNGPPTVSAGPDRAVTLPSSASLDGTVGDATPTGTLTSSWSETSGPGEVTFGSASAVDTTASFSVAGTYVLRLTATDGSAAPASDETTVVVSPAATGAGGITEVEVPVRAGSDDAEQVPGKSAYLDSGDLELVVDGTRVQTVGLRFTGVGVPKGSFITSAYVQFQADEAKTAGATLTVAGEAADNPATFTTAVGSVTGRQATAAKVPWSPTGWSSVGARTAAQQTPDLSGVVQEIVDRPGWGSGNAMVLLVTGSGTRTAEAFEGGAARAAVLHIAYSSTSDGEGTANRAPVVDAGPAELTVTMPAAAELAGSVTDDGQPAGSTVTAAWTEVSGHGGVTFADAGAASTTATFATAGNYVLRLTGSDGLLAATDDVSVTVAPEGTVAVAGSIYGIEPEAHSHVPPYADGNGNLYRVTEEYYDPVPNHNTPMMMKSADGGQTWAQVDAANRPTDRDLEGSWLLQSGTSLIYVHTNGARITYSEFHTSDAPGTPDRWVVQNEQGITGLDSDPRQWACAARTGDGRLWVFFADSTVGGRFQLAYIRREAPGSWTPKTRISTDAESLAGATCVVDPVTDVTHVFYHDYAGKQVLYRSLTPDGTLSSAVRADTSGTNTAERNYHAVANPVVYSAEGSTVVSAMFASATDVRVLSVVDGVVAPEQVVDPAAPLISPWNIGRNTGGDGPVMHLAVDGSTLHAVWAVASTGDVWYASRPHAGQWTSPTRLVDAGAGHVGWLYANVYPLGGQRVLGYTYDLGPHEDNGGDIRYRHMPL